MEEGRRLISSTEISLAKENACVGHRIRILCCQNCGYMKLGKENEG
jgi:hypothetical protein